MHRQSDGENMDITEGGVRLTINRNGGTLGIRGILVPVTGPDDFKELVNVLSIVAIELDTAILEEESKQKPPETPT